MKITLNKTVTLNVATVYMKIKKDVNRTDIQEYLNGKRFEEPINRRINEYLKEIKIYDSTYQLTSLGRAVEKTGLLPTYEEGKYKIWYTNDYYFSNIIMYLRRERANENSIVESLGRFQQSGHFIMQTNEEKYAKFELKETQLNGKQFSNTEDVTATLILETDKPTYCFFSGSLGKDGKIKLDHSIAVKRDDVLENVVREILPEWDTDSKRLKVDFNKLAEVSRNSFSIENHPCLYRGFNGKIDSVKLMPKDLTNAKKWRDYLLVQEVKKDYLTSEDFDHLVLLTNNREAFSSYKMDVPNVKQFKQSHNTSNDKDVVFWHLNAPMDLNPETNSYNNYQIL